MSQITKIADDLLAVEKQYRAVLKAGEFLRGIGNVERLEGEVRGRLAAAEKEEAAAIAKLADTQANVIAAQAQYETIAKSAKQAIADAREARDAMIADAQKAIAAERDAANAQLREIAAAAKLADEEIAKKVREIGQLTAQRDKLEADLETLRKAAASIAGK